MKTSDAKSPKLGHLYRASRAERAELEVARGSHEWAPQVLSEHRCLCGEEQAWVGFMLGPACWPKPARMTAASVKAIPRGWANGPKRDRNGILARSKP